MLDRGCLSLEVKINTPFAHKWFAEHRACLFPPCIYRNVGCLVYVQRVEPRRSPCRAPVVRVPIASRDYCATPQWTLSLRRGRVVAAIVYPGAWRLPSLRAAPLILPPLPCREVERRHQCKTRTLPWMSDGIRNAAVNLASLAVRDTRLD